MMMMMSEFVSLLSSLLLLMTKMMMSEFVSLLSSLLLLMMKMKISQEEQKSL